MYPRPTSYLCAVAVLLSGGCASLSEPLPAAITSPPPGNLQLVEVMRDIDAHAGRFVRWGGTVVEVHPEGDGVARIEVLERKLGSHGETIAHGASDGRFVIRAASGVSASRYSVGSEITVAGTVNGALASSSGPLVPVLQVQHFMRWLPPPSYHHRYRPGSLWYDDPLYGPYGPWYHSPWYRHRIHYGVGFHFH